MNTLRRALLAATLLSCALPSFGQVPYCIQTKPTSVAGCLPALTSNDLSLATGTWDVSQVPVAPGDVSTNGMFIYTNGPGIGQSPFNVSVPFGSLCVSQFKRSSPACAKVQFNGPTNSCIGSFSMPIGCSAGALGIVVGDDVNVQCWYRDPGISDKALFTNAIFYTVL